MSLPFIANSTVITVDNPDSGFSSSGFSDSVHTSDFVASKKYTHLFLRAIRPFWMQPSVGSRLFYGR
jgi:hypothetical protein